MNEEILKAVAEALKAVTHPRFFRSERGYHGRFYCALQDALDKGGVLQGGIILEMEYQKSSRHGVTQRPDIILHTPAEKAGAPVHENNVAVFALKLRASLAKATEDFCKLDKMVKNLHYLLAVFINVDSEVHYLDQYTGPYCDRLHVFTVVLKSGRPHVTHAWWSDDKVREDVV